LPICNISSSRSRRSARFKSLPRGRCAPHPHTPTNPHTNTQQRTPRTAQRTTHNAQRTTHNARRTTHTPQGTTSTPQGARHNTQRTTGTYTHTKQECRLSSSLGAVRACAYHLRRHVHTTFAGTCMPPSRVYACHLPAKCVPLVRVAGAVHLGGAVCEVLSVAGCIRHLVKKIQTSHQRLLSFDSAADVT
jgi:hypothetical protein